MSPDPHTVEGIARVVRIEDGTAWCEPEQTTSCGHCASSGVCVGGSTNGIGSIARRIELRRFPLADCGHLHVGERVVLGVSDRALLKASATAYGIPLLMVFLAGGIAQGVVGDDLLTMMSMFAGLFAGLLLAAWVARHLSKRGELSLRFLRRAGPGDSCGSGT